MTFYIVLCLILLFYVVQYIIMIILKGHLDCFNTGRDFLTREITLNTTVYESKLRASTTIRPEGASRFT